MKSINKNDFFLSFITSIKCKKINEAETQLRSKSINPSLSIVYKLQLIIDHTSSDHHRLLHVEEKHREKIISGCVDNNVLQVPHFLDIKNFSALCS